VDELGISHRLDSDGIVHVEFDRPNDKVNLLTPDLLRFIGRLCEDLGGRQDVRGVLFQSAKPGMFIAGMDVDQIAGVTDAYKGAEGARFGQAVFQKIAELPVPTACAINGTCLGGGTEMALACTFRVASDDPAVRIGLPEVQIGIIPGFGGTQRLPRLVGLTASLDLILTGRRIDAKKAARIGLVDKVVPAEYLLHETAALLERAADDGVAPTVARVRKRRSALSRLPENVGPLRTFVLNQARKKTAQKIKKEHYPAPFRALEAVEVAFTQPLPHGLDFEARLEGELITSATARNLMWLFKSHTALKKDSGVRATPREVRRSAVLGAGIMGGGISQLAADNGIPVRLRDIRYDAVLTALQTADGLWQKKLKRRRITRGELARRMAFIAPTLEPTGLRHVDLVIEAVVEDLEVKRRVLAEIEPCIDERAVFASNTSSLPISDIAARALHPERVVGLHFFNPVHRMPLVEVIAGERSSPEAVSTVHRFALRVGKVPVVVKDSPGFLVNRILMFYMNEALQLLSEGVRVEAADEAMKAFGMPMGPFELFDTVGLDTARHVAGVLGAAFGSRAGGDDSLLGSMVAKERLGRKNDLGFYRWRDGKPGGVDSEVYTLAGSPAPRDLPPETLQERMVLTMVNEAAVCLEEGVVREPREIDIAMVMGTGFPPFRGGLLRHADAVGIPIVADRLSRLGEAHGDRFRPAGLLNEMVRAQKRFYSNR
jgi:3-hydroxyacyl-CoA dehydrogenase/enoyl-CoA hydratase/3-hydroxybutyryl-CoA epimerase